MISVKSDQLDLLDFLSIASFVIGYFNYTENVGQSEMQDAINGAIKEIHDHLKIQDDKIDKILEKLGGVNK
jgi:hypothetical protein